MAETGLVSNKKKIWLKWLNRPRLKQGKLDLKKNLNTPFNF
jgi:hypothetical protein